MTPHEAEDPDGENGPSLPQLTLLVTGLVVVLAVGGQLLHPARGAYDAAPTGVGLAAAYLGGLLAFLSPCSVAVIPGFFAYAFDQRADLLRHTYVFYLGLALVFVPLGFGASLTGELLQTHRSLLVLVAGWTMILLGLAVLLNVPMPSGNRFLPDAVTQGSNLTTRVFLLGAFFGLATSTCTAPILAGITVLSVGAGLGPLHAILLFLVFALGIASPLFLLAWAGDRTALLERFRGGTWTLTLGEREVAMHSSRVITGLVLVALGVVFLVTDGTRTLLDAYDTVGATALYERLDAQIRDALAGWRGRALTAGVLATLAAWGLWRRKTGPDGDD